MSALDHKWTYAVQKGMSALPPKADINRDIRGRTTGSNARSSTRPWEIIEWWMFSGEAIIVL